MADRIDPSTEIPEADLLEQQSPIDPQAMIDDQEEPAGSESPTDPVNEADRLEQQALLPTEDEDDYPHHPGS
jgi:hypothetical protein